MMKMTSLSLVLALALVGCGDNLHVGGDDDGNGSGSSEPQPEPQLDATGTYRLHSTFDVATNMPGSSGAFVNGLIAATDDPDDPMSWLLDQMLAQMPDGTVKDILVAAKPFVAGYLNDRLTALAPELVGTVVDVGHRMRDLTKELGVSETLDVTTVDQVYAARITADGLRFKVDSNLVDVAFADHGIDDVVADGVLVTFEKTDGRFAIGEHTLPLPYAQIVRLGLDTAIIPAIDPAAHDLSDLLEDVIDCGAVGAGVSDALGIGNAAFWTSACHAGLDGAAGLAYDQIAGTGSTLDMHLAGTAHASDADHDHKLDTLASGTWTGSMTYSGTDATLAQPATFVGERL